MEWMPFDELKQLYRDQLGEIEQYIRDFETPNHQKDDNWKPKVSLGQLYLMRSNLAYALSLMSKYNGARADQREHSDKTDSNPVNPVY